MPAVRTVAAAATIALAATTGCGPNSPPADDPGVVQPTPPGYEPPVDLWTDVTAFDWPGSSKLLAEHCPSDEAVHLPSDVVADEVELVVCSTEIRSVPGDGSWRFAIVSRVTDGLDQLLTAYAEPDDDTEVDACTAQYVDPGHVWLQVAGEVVTVRAPKDRCHPLENATRAYSSLRLETVAEERLDQTSTQLSDDTGCPDDWLDVLAADVPTGADQPSAPWALHEGRMAACTYDVELGAAGRGRLVDGRHLSRETRAAVNDQLEQSRRDSTCQRAGHTQFVVLAASSGFVQHTYVALEGCAVQQNDAWWRATDELRGLLS